MEIEFALPFLLTFFTLAAYGLGHYIRDYAHVIIPFKDPASLLIMFALFIPVIMGMWYPEYQIMASNVWYLASVVGIIAGYSIGYLGNHINMEYVGVHYILEKRQDIYPIVYYYDKEGNMFLQPQGFKDIIKSMIFRVRYPLYLPLNMVVRKRSVSFRKIFVRASGEVIDLAGHTVETSTVKKGPFKFKVESHHYTPTPNCTDSPYDWIVRAAEYEDVFTEFTEQQVALMESKAELQVATVKGGATVLTALSGKSPSELFIKELGLDLDDIVSRKAAIRKELKNEQKKQKKGDTNADE